MRASGMKPRIAWVSAMRYSGWSSATSRWFMALLCRPCPVDGNRGAGDVVRLAPAQPEHGIGDFLRTGHAQARLLLAQQSAHAVVAAAAFHPRLDLRLDQRRFHPARADAVDGDAAGFARAGRGVF